MSLFDELKMYGVDVDDGIDRMMGNAGLYQKLLFKFLEMVKEFLNDFSFDSNDYNDMIEKVHKIKGAAGNLSVVPLYKAYSEMLSLLREGKPDQAKEVYSGILSVQDKIIACIEKYA